MILVGLTAKMRSGKDTVYEMLAAKELGLGNFVRVAYGDELKRRFAELHGYDENNKDRRGLQEYGQGERKKNPNVWLEPVDEKLQHLLNFEQRNVVITDVRQPNEVEQIRQYGGYLVRINVRDDIRLERMNAAGDNFTLEDLQHETEQYIDTFEVDYEIYNDGDKYDLYQQVRYMINSIRMRERKAWTDSSRD